MLTKFCKEIAELSHLNHKIGAITLDKSGRKISFACNIKKTHPRQAKIANDVGFPKKIFLHAELRSIIRAQKKVHSIFVVRVGRKGNLLLAKPCEICRVAIEEAGIKEIYYSDNNGKIKHEFLYP